MAHGRVGDSMTAVSPKSQFRMSWVAALACAAAGALVFQFFGNSNHGYIDTASLFYWWGFQWVNPASETEHGWLILGLSAWLLWRNLQIANCGSRIADFSDRRFATLVMIGALLLHAVGFAVQQARISILALLLFSWGVLALGGGLRWRRAAAFPLAFMVFAIPLTVLDSVGFWLRLWVIKASSGIAHAAGIGVLQSGTQLMAPDGRYQYDVAAACSGVRSLMALAALSLLVGYLNFRSWWLRAVVFLLCFPLVYLGNVARITSIIFAAQWRGQAWGEHVHDVMGYGIFLIVLGGVLGAVSILRRLTEGREERPARPPDGGEISAAEVTHLPAVGSAKAGPYLVALAVVILAVAEMFFLTRLTALSPPGAAGLRLSADGRNPVSLPDYLGIEWTGESVPVTAAEREILPPDTGYSRKLYFNHHDATQQAFLSIVLSGRDRTSIHRPEICLVAQGWTLLGTSEHRFSFPGHPEAAFPATLLHVQREALTPRGRETIQALVAYWFVSSDAVVASHVDRMWHDAWNRMRHLRADRWAYVLMLTDTRAGEAAALARMQTVLDQTLPDFQLPLVAP